MDRKYLVNKKDIGWKSRLDADHDPSEILARSIAVTKGAIKLFDCTDQDFSKIKTMVPDGNKISREDAYTFKVQLANNLPDRTGERFHENTLKTLADTIIGKGFLIAHKWEEPGFGWIYNATIRKTQAPWQFKSIRFMTQWLDVDVVMRKDGETLDGRSNPEIIKNIEWGMARFASIGFRTPARIEVLDQKNKFMYYELVDDPDNDRYSEGLEGSLVWLGAQYMAGPIMKEMRKGITVSIDDKDYLEIFQNGNLHKYINLIGKEVNQVDEKKNASAMIQEPDEKTILLDDNDDMENIPAESKEASLKVKVDVNDDAFNSLVEKAEKLRSVLDEIEDELLDPDEDDESGEEDVKEVEYVEIDLSELESRLDKLEKSVSSLTKVIRDSVPIRKGLYTTSETTVHDNEESPVDDSQAKAILGSGNPMIRD